MFSSRYISYLALYPLEDDERDGMGIFFYSDGGRFEGRWESNRRNGQGTMAYANGEVSKPWIDLAIATAGHHATMDDDNYDDDDGAGDDDNGRISPGGILLVVG